MNKYKVEHSDGAINLLNIELSKNYRNWREVCDVLEIDYNKYKQTHSKGHILNKIKRHMEVSRGVNTSRSFKFTKFKNKNPKLVEKIYQGLIYSILNKELLLYKADNLNKEINYIDFIDSDFVNAQTYIILQYYSSEKHSVNKLKIRIIKSINKVNKLLSEEDINGEILLQVQNHLVKNKVTTYNISNLDNFKSKNILLDELPEYAYFDNEKMSKLIYVCNYKDKKVTIKNKQSIHMPKSNVTEINKSRVSNYKSIKDASIAMKDVLSYCKYIENYFPQEYYIYKYENKLSGLVYIGMTKSLYSRQSNRFKDAQSPFDNIIRMIGLNNFKFGVIGYANSKKEARKLEKKYIKLYDSKNNGYNMKV